MFTVKESAPPKDPEIVNSQNDDTVSRAEIIYPTNQPTLPPYLFVARGSIRISAGRSVRGTSTSIVVVRASVVIGIVVRSIAVTVMVATSAAGVGTSGGIVVVSLAVGSRTSHSDLRLVCLVCVLTSAWSGQRVCR